MTNENIDYVRRMDFDRLDTLVSERIAALKLYAQGVGNAVADEAAHDAICRGDKDIPQFDPREIGEAIDAAVEMIERMDGALESLLIRRDDSDSAMYGTLSTSFVRDAVRIARGEQE